MDSIEKLRLSYEHARDVRDRAESVMMECQNKYYDAMISDLEEEFRARGGELHKTTVTRWDGEGQKYKVIDVVVSGDTEEAMYLLAPIVNGMVGPRQAAVRADEIFLETGAKTNDV